MGKYIVKGQEKETCSVTSNGYCSTDIFQAVIYSCNIYSIRDSPVFFFFFEPEEHSCYHIELIFFFFFFVDSDDSRIEEMSPSC